MTISTKLRNYMNRCGVAFEEVPHEFVVQSAKAAQATHVPGRHVAKGVLVRAGDEYLMAVVPSSRRVALGRLRHWLGRDVRLAEELESVPLFEDCALGAMPPVGAAFGLETILDEDLGKSEDVYFEGGDHRTLVHVAGSDWRRLHGEAARCPLSA
jgi:Ala-tRNA(Pro) deacylase